MVREAARKSYCKSLGEELLRQSCLELNISMKIAYRHSTDELYNATSKYIYMLNNLIPPKYGQAQHRQRGGQDQISRGRELG